VLLVEGKNDKEFIYHLSNCAAIPRGSFHIPDADVEISGVDSLLASLPGEIVASDLQRLGILLDADHDISARWTSVRDRLEAIGYTALPTTPVPDGMIHRELGQRVTVGVWLMPDNVMPGAIENFAASLVPSEDTLWNLALSAISQIPARERRFRPSYEAKAQVHTWLAWQEEPGTPLGLALTRQYLNVGALPAVRFVAWLKRLFELP
jgi:hypothetical protein